VPIVQTFSKPDYRRPGLPRKTTACETLRKKKFAPCDALGLRIVGPIAEPYPFMPAAVIGSSTTPRTSGSAPKNVGICPSRASSETSRRNSAERALLEQLRHLFATPVAPPDHLCGDGIGPPAPPESAQPPRMAARTPSGPDCGVGANRPRNIG